MNSPRRPLTHLAGVASRALVTLVAVTMAGCLPSGSAPIGRHVLSDRTLSGVHFSPSETDGVPSRLLVTGPARDTAEVCDIRPSPYDGGRSVRDSGRTRPREPRVARPGVEACWPRSVLSRWTTPCGLRGADRHSWPAVGRALPRGDRQRRFDLRHLSGRSCEPGRKTWLEAYD